MLHQSLEESCGLDIDLTTEHGTWVKSLPLENGCHISYDTLVVHHINYLAHLITQEVIERYRIKGKAEEAGNIISWKFHIKK